MAITYNAKDAVRVFDAGEYDAILEKCIEGTSKATGNPMLTLTWKVHCEETNRSQLVTDYIVVPAMVWKIKKIAVAFGKLKEFEDERFQPEDYTGWSCRLTLKVEKQDGFDDKNGVAGYKPMAQQAPKESKPSGSLTPALQRQLERAERQAEPTFAESAKLDDDCPF